jgi:N-methylhydantoinase B/oxoprolinase/acetone carboxylase alpha subunit
MGIRRDLEVLCERATLSLQTDRRRSRPWGRAGGEPGESGRNLLIREGAERELADKCTLEVRWGDVISIRTPGGGGWGSP